MKILPPLRDISSTEWLILISAGIWAFLVIQFHYYFEIFVVIKNGAPYFFVIFHYIGVPFGTITSIKTLKKLSRSIKFLLGSGLIAFSFIISLLVNEIWVIPIAYTIAGFFIGFSCSSAFSYNRLIFTNAQFGGRSLAFGLTLPMLLLIFEALFNFILGTLIGIFMFLILFLLIVVFILVGENKKDVLKLPIERTIDIKTYFRNRNNLSIIAFIFILGFFWVNNYYAGVLILDNSGLIDKLGIFITFTFLGAAIFFLPVGNLADIIGRRFSILIGLAIQSVSLIIPSLINTNEIVILIIFPFFIGIGFAMIIGVGMTVMFESPDPEYFEYSISIYFTVFTPGMLISVIIVEIIKPYFLTTPASLTIIMLFIFVLATIIIFQLKETLPSKAELEWKDSIQYLYIIRGSGIPIFTYNFSEERESEDHLRDTLLSGVLTAISSATRRITREESPLKQVEHENFTIMLEEGVEIFIALISKKELKVLRKKMKDFLDDFQDFFGELLATDTSDKKVFSPAKKLVEKHFS